MANNKVQLANGTVLIDLTDTTATAADVAAGKDFYGADGIKYTGTNSGGGTGGIVYQDLDGYVHLSEDAANVISIVDTLDEHGGTIRTIESVVQSENVKYMAEDFVDPTKPVGPVVFDIVQFPDTAACTYFAYRTNITKLFGRNFNETKNAPNMFRYMTSLEYAIFPKATKFYNGMFYHCQNLIAIDWLGSPSLGIYGSSLIFADCLKLKIMIIRTTEGVCRLDSTANNFNNTPFASGKAGGTIYIPKVLYDELGTGSSLDYKAATNWSTIDGYGTITWACIEGSIYETQYADGTPIESE